MFGIDIDIVYEGRNKEYGSYVLRKEYPKRVLTGLVSGICIVVLPILGYYFYLKLGPLTENQAITAPVIEVNQLSDLPLIDVAPLPKNENENAKPPTDPVIDDKDTEEVKKEQKQQNRDSVAKQNVDGAMASANQLPRDTAFYASDVDNMPEFAGGQLELNRFISRNLLYPDAARNRKLQGKVVVRFIISKTGDIKEVSIVTGVAPELDNEVLRVIRLLPRWKPGSRLGRPVGIIYTFPIVFKL